MRWRLSCMCSEKFCDIYYRTKKDAEQNMSATVEAAKEHCAEPFQVSLEGKSGKPGSCGGWEVYRVVEVAQL